METRRCFSALEQFGFGGKQPQDQKQVVITSYSQPHVLQQRMKEEKLTHGDRVKADISPVRLESIFSKMVMYFCPMNTINVHEKLEHGDGKSLPCEAIIEGLAVPATLRPGLYNLKNVELFSNGTLQVIATADTMFEAVANEPCF